MHPRRAVRPPRMVVGYVMDRKRDTRHWTGKGAAQGGVDKAATFTLRAIWRLAQVMRRYRTSLRACTH